MRVEVHRLETYRLYANLPVFKRRLCHALTCIRDALAEEPASYVAWSGGKDSTVLLHLVRRVEPDIPVLNVRTDIEYPDCAEFVDRLINEWKPNVHVILPPSAWQVLVEEGGPFGQVNVATSRIDKECFFEPLAQEVEARGYAQVFLGLRAEESRGRKMNIRARGHRYYNKTRSLWTSLPLARWTAKDVFAYHVTNDIPWSPIYDREFLHPEPERIREGWWTTGEAAARRGMVVWLRYHYPELWARLREQFPEVAMCG